MNKKVLMVTVTDDELGTFTALFVSVDELSRYLDDVKRDTGYTPKIIDCTTLTLLDVINGRCHKDIDRDARIETVAEMVLKDNVRKAFHYTRDIENVLEFLGIYVK